MLPTAILAACLLAAGAPLPAAAGAPGIDVVPAGAAAAAGAPGSAVTPPADVAPRTDTDPAAAAGGTAGLPPALAPADSVPPLPLPAAGGPRRLRTHYFYHHRDYGSDALVHPLRLIINGGYGIMQLENRPNTPFDVDYEGGARNVWRNLRDPFTAIERQGWWDFISAEIIPISVNNGQAQYWPNYTQHLIGGGMSYRLMAEWFDWHGYPRPKLWAGGTIAVYHFLNEVVENNGRHEYSTDAIADLYIFDPLSIVLFSSESVCRFFSGTLHLTDWSYQPVYDPDNRTLQNNGQNFAMKLRLPWSERWSLFYHYGTHGELGLSRLFDGGHSLSFGAGLKASDLIEIDEHTKTVDLAMSAGIFYDRDGSLMASLLYSRSKVYQLRLNLYPGLLRLGPVSPGLFTALDRDGRTVAGITLLATRLPVGYGLHF